VNTNTNVVHKVSVIVPVCNVERYLDQCLTSIELQPFKNLEIICLNDGSKDGSLKIMQRHAVADQRVVVVDKENEGYGATCNRGINMATGDYVSIVEPDDYLTGDMYGDLLSFADSLEGPVDVIESSYWRIFESGTANELRVLCPYHDRVNPPSQPFSIGDGHQLLEHHPSIWTALYRKAWLDEKGIRFNEYPGAGWADNPFLIETLCQTDRIAYVNKPYYNYREDTEEKAIAYAKRNPLMPLERWNDMQDIVERLGVTDRRVLAAQTKRAMTYCGTTIESVGLDYPGVHDAVTHIYQRLDYDLVMEQPLVTVEQKKLYCRLIGRPEPNISRLGMVPTLLSEGVYRLSHTNMRYTWLSVKSFFGHRRARAGQQITQIED
jgi:glycosyltransferase involved in cell wall biosynthesis